MGTFWACLHMWVMNGIFPGGMKPGMSPTSTVPFSENFTISMKGTAVNTMIATTLGTLVAAPLMNLLPYPMSCAARVMKDNAVKASKDTGMLFEAVIEYYCGAEGSVVVESCTKHAEGLRKFLDSLGGPIGAAWWECFDMGT